MQSGGGGLAARLSSCVNLGTDNGSVAGQTWTMAAAWVMMPSRMLSMTCVQNIQSTSTTPHTMKTTSTLLLAGATMLTLLLSACDGGPYNGRSPNTGGYSGFNSGFRGMSANYGGYDSEQRNR